MFSPYINLAINPSTCACVVKQLSEEPDKGKDGLFSIERHCKALHQQASLLGLHPERIAMVTLIERC